MEHITSTDGARIAFKRSGAGPALVLVHGGPGDHTRWNPLVEHLRDCFTVYAMDRRGRGGSGDAAEYSLEREYDDVIAIAEAIDGAVNLYGHSFGAICALGAAPRIRNLNRLILYEAPIPGIAGLTPTEVIDRIQNHVDQGRPEEALIIALREIVQMAPDEIEHFRTLPGWPERVASAHTIAREERAWNEYRLDTDQLRALEVPTLLLTGSDSPPFLKDSVTKLHEELPNSHIHELPGQQHTADVMAPEMVSRALIDFLTQDVGSGTATESRP